MRSSLEGGRWPLHCNVHVRAHAGPLSAQAHGSLNLGDAFIGGGDGQGVCGIHVFIEGGRQNDIQKLQACISDIKYWSIHNCLKLNADKAEVLHFTSKFRQSHQLEFVTLDESVVNTVRPNKKETRFISDISSLPRKIETNCMLHYQEHFLFFHLIPNT